MERDRKTETDRQRQIVSDRWTDSETEMDIDGLIDRQMNGPLQTCEKGGDSEL